MKKNIILSIVLAIFIILAIFSTIKIIIWFRENKETKKQINQIYEVTEIKESAEGTIIENENIKEFDPYFDYINMSLIDVNFDNLKKINDDTVAWIKVNGTNVNYPIVKTTDNSFYLTHTFNKNYNTAGWVFMDYRNSIESFNQNTIIYAHGRLDNSMFGSLRKILNNDWYNNKDNYVIKMSTETENTLWQIFSVYRIKTTNDYLYTNFSNQDEFLSFANKMLERSKFDFYTTVNKNDKIITLSTCFDDYEKLVIHAKLIKIEKK